MTDDIMTVGPLQLEILGEMWAQPLPVTVAFIHELINSHRRRDRRAVLAYTTYLTVMRNLARRKLVSQSAVSGTRGHQFSPLITKAQYVDQYLRITLANVFAGNHSHFVTAVKSLELAQEST